MSALEEIFARFKTEFDDSELQRGDEATSALTGSLRKLGGLLAGGVLAAGARRFVNASADIGDELDKSSRVIGIDTQALQSWRHAANLSGVSSGSFTQGLIKLQRTMGDAQRGTATALEPFRDLGVAFEDSAGRLRPVEDVLHDLADPLATMESSSERVALLSTLMGRAGARVGPLFEQGAEGVAAMRQELEDLGGGASQEMIDAAAELTDANARLDLAFLGLRSRIATGVLPMVQRGVELFTRFTVAVGRLWENSKILQAGLTVVGVVAGVVAAKMVLGFAPVIAAFLGMAVAAAVVLVVVEDFLVALDGGPSVLGDFTAGIYEWIDANEGVSVIADVWKGLLETMTSVYEFIGTPLAALGIAESENLDHEDELTDVRGLVRGERFSSNEDAEGFRSSFQGRAQRFGRDRRETEARIARNRERGGTSAPDASEFTSIRGLGSPAVEREAAAARPAPAPAPAITIVQENTTNVSGLGLDERGVQRVLTRNQRDLAEDLLATLTGGVGE